MRGKDDCFSSSVVTLQMPPLLAELLSDKDQIEDIDSTIAVDIGEAWDLKVDFTVEVG